MWIFRLRDPRTLALLGLGLAVMTGTVLYDVVPTIEHEHEVLFTVPWGAEEGKLGLAPGQDQMMYGPRSFFVDSGQVVVADTFNARVQMFDLSGDLENVISLRDLGPLEDHALAVFAAAGGEEETPDLQYSLAAGDPWINDLVVAPDGSLYLADGAGPQIIALAADGQVLNRIDLTIVAPGAGFNGQAAEADEKLNDPVWVLEQLALDSSGVVYLAHSYLSDQVFARNLVRVDPATEQFVRVSSVAMREGGSLVVDAESRLPAPANSFALAPDGGLYVESQASDPFGRHVRRYGEGERLTEEWLVRHKRKVIRAALLGADVQKRAYLLMNGGRSDGAIVQISPGGETAVLARPEWDPGYAANIHGRVSADGSVYVALSGQDGWRLERWQATHGWRLQAVARRR